MNIQSLVCPVCSTSSFQKKKAVQDHFLTKEPFELYQCEGCGVLRTAPFPADSEIFRYYDSSEYLSHGDEQKGLFPRLYRLAKAYNLGWKARLLKGLKRDASFLDYGCGTGDLLEQCQAVGFKVRGAEPSDAAISRLGPLVKDKVVSPEEELHSIRQYHIISMWHVLEHIKSPRRVLSALIAKIHTDGYLVIALPNNTSLDARHYGEYWAGWDVPRHLWHYTPDQIIEIAQSLGLTHITSYPMWFDAYYVSLLSERYRKGGPFKAFVWATLSNLKALFNKKRRCSSQVYLFRKN